MQANQAGMDSDEKVGFFKETTRRVHRYNCPVILQISHAGRQTSFSRASGRPGGASGKRSAYFRVRPRALSTEEVYKKAEEYGLAAKRAKMAGFDGVQVHAAHGYLVHQFLMPATNRRSDKFGINEGDTIGTRFLEEVIMSVRKYCGNNFPLWVKVSGGVDLRPRFTAGQFIALIRFLDRMKVAAIEVSYGTMDHPLNIFRGDFPVGLIMSENPFFKSTNPIRRRANKLLLDTYFRQRRKRISSGYNLPFAELAKKHTAIPVISVGGFRDAKTIFTAIHTNRTDLISMSRPFISEPDLVMKMNNHKNWVSSCINCNYCAVMCDSGKPTKCYQSKKKEEPWNFSVKYQGSSAGISSGPMRSGRKTG
jgi:2,4-dienoyl-CoA reductase-like NADH-dependent reductase (Old Yellow Enzyme family)